MKELTTKLVDMVAAYNEYAKAANAKTGARVSDKEFWEMWQPLGAAIRDNAKHLRELLEAHNIEYSYSFETMLITIK